MTAAKQPDYIKKIEEYSDDMLEDLKTLVKCESQSGEPEDGAPFGRGPAEALDAMLAIGRREGMKAESVDGYAGYIEYGDQDKDSFGILTHLDVVPGGNGWTHGGPFDPVFEDGRLYGRGTSDDKGPSIAAFYALKALKDCGYEFDKRVRMIFGLNEEVGEESLDYYKAHEEIPSFSIVPDSDFPVVSAEKGIMVFDLVKYFGIHRNNGPAIVSIKGGSAANMVPDKAEAVVKGVGNVSKFIGRVKEFSDVTHYDISASEEEDGNVRITAKGQAAHGSTPWKGVNAISVLMQFLYTIDVDSEEIRETLDFYEFHIGHDMYGERLGINLKDDKSGLLVLNVGVIDMDESKIRITFNARIPVTMSDNDVKSGIAALLIESNIDLEETMYQPPLYYEPDDPRITKLADIYSRFTGDTESKPLVIGGGTYARQIDNAVAFGAMYPGDEDRMHCADEYVTVDRLVQTAKIYAETIYEFAVKHDESNN